VNLEPGLRVTEHIELRFPIGDGGMGRVWAADHIALGRQVAVKFVALALTDDPDATRRFALEGHTLARLQSAYAPQVFDCGTLTDGTPFIVMELLSGVSLQTRLQNDGCLSLALTTRLVRQVGSVLSSAHALGIVHRDIKPENIILVPGDGDAFTAKVLDFGIAKAEIEAGSKALTRTGMTLGTPSYMSPEQLLSAQSVDGRADLWSTAVVAYCCLTGELPFAGDTFGAVCMAIHRGVVVEASALRAGLPRGLNAWFHKSWAPVLEDRFASAEEMVDAFSAAADGSPVAVPPSGAVSEVHSLAPTETQPPPKKRTRARVPFAIVALAVVTLFFSSWTIHGGFDGSATEKRAQGAVRSVQRWTGSHTFRWPFASVAESAPSEPSVAGYVADRPTPSAILEPADSAADSPSADDDKDP
jgi:serine/threonine protein kinase